MVDAGMALAYRKYSTKYVPNENKARKPRKGSGLESSFILGIGARGSDLSRVNPANQINHRAAARYARRVRLAGILVSRRPTAVVSQRVVLVTRNEGSTDRRGD